MDIQRTPTSSPRSRRLLADARTLLLSVALAFGLWFGGGLLLAGQVSPPSPGDAQHEAILSSDDSPESEPAPGDPTIDALSPAAAPSGSAPGHTPLAGS